MTGRRRWCPRIPREPWRTVWEVGLVGSVTVLFVIKTILEIRR